MTQLASDNFTRANSTGLGANWTAAHDFDSGGFDVVSNTAKPHQTTLDCRDDYTGTTAPADQYSEVTLTGVSASGAGSGVGPCCRSNAGATTYYRLIANGSGYEVGKSVAGTFTSLSSGSGTTFANGDVARLEVQGTTWRAKKNGTQFATGTDAALASGDWGIAYSSTDTGAAVSLWAGGDFSTGTAPFKPIDTDERIFPRIPLRDFAAPNLLTQGTLKLPPFTQSNDGARTWWWRGVYTDFNPPNLLAAKFLPPPPIAAVDLSQPLAPKWAATDFVPQNILSPAVPSPYLPIDLGAKVFAKGLYTDQIPPNLTLNLPKPPIVPTEWVIRIEAKGVYTDFAPPNLNLNTLAPAAVTPLLPQDISGIRLDTRAVRSDFAPPNLLTGILPIAPPTPPPVGAGRHKSRAEAHRRHHQDVLRAQVEAFKEQRRSAEQALIASEDREVKARAKVLKRVRVKPGLNGLRKPIEHYAPVKRAIAQRTDALARYRSILRAQAEHDKEVQRVDEEAAVHFMHFLMQELEWDE